MGRMAVNEEDDKGWSSLHFEKWAEGPVQSLNAHGHQQGYSQHHSYFLNKEDLAILSSLCGCWHLRASVALNCRQIHFPFSKVLVIIISQLIATWVTIVYSSVVPKWPGQLSTEGKWVSLTIDVLPTQEVCSGDSTWLHKPWLQPLEGLQAPWTPLRWISREEEHLRSSVIVQSHTWI